MKIRDLSKLLNERQPDEDIAVLWYTKDEFDQTTSVSLSEQMWQRVVDEFENCDDVDASVTSFLTDEIAVIVKEGDTK